jgi:hypothetical protein
MRVRIPNGVIRPFLIVTVAGGLLSGACALEEADQQALVGPSETGLSVQMVALPDLLNADGVSQSVVEMVLRDANGDAVSGRAVLFCVTPSVPAPPAGVPPPSIVVGECEASNVSGESSLTPQSGYTYVGPVQSGIVMATNQAGAARVVWQAGTNHNTVIVIGVRTYGIDASRGFLQTVQIFQQ